MSVVASDIGSPKIITLDILKIYEKCTLEVFSLYIDVIILHPGECVISGPQGQPHSAPQGTPVTGTVPQLSQNGQQEKKLNAAKSFKNYFTMRAERRKEEEKHWEEIGDEDLIGNVKGKFGFKRIFWKGSLDSQGCPTASSVIIKDIFRHCVRVSIFTIAGRFSF